MEDYTQHCVDLLPERGLSLGGIMAAAAASGASRFVHRWDPVSHKEE
jgi:hypothetical protein